MWAYSSPPTLKTPHFWFQRWRWRFTPLVLPSAYLLEIAEPPNLLSGSSINLFVFALSLFNLSFFSSADEVFLAFGSCATKVFVGLRSQSSSKSFASILFLRFCFREFVCPLFCLIFVYSFLYFFFWHSVDFAGPVGGQKSPNLSAQFYDEVHKRLQTA